MKIDSLKWILYVSRRFSRVDRKGRSKVTSSLASLGIAFGVMTLIVVVSVMNGFQMSFIDSIMEISSCHIMTRFDKPHTPDVYDDFVDFCLKNDEITFVMPFYESQCLFVGKNGTQSASLLRAVESDLYVKDLGFQKEFKILSGAFNLTQQNSIIIGSPLARSLGVKVGDTVNILALSGGSDVELFSDDRIFTVTGIFTCNYADISNAYSFISYDDGKRMLGSESVPQFGIKIKNTNLDSRVISEIEKYDLVKCESWRSYNRSFFGALSVEKNLLMMLVFLIFVVVAVNIFNGMRRMVYEKREEISVLSAIGAGSKSIQSIFIMQGFLIGLRGTVPGVILGLLLSVRIDSVFTLAANIMYKLQYFFTILFSPSNIRYITPNATFLYYAHIPARVILNEVVIIALFGFLSSLFAAWSASRGILKLSIAEVLHDE